MQKRLALEVGNIVHLNSGSPDLKILLLSDGCAEVEWKDENGTECQMLAPAVCFTTVHRKDKYAR